MSTTRPDRCTGLAGAAALVALLGVAPMPARAAEPVAAAASTAASAPHGSPYARAAREQAQGSTEAHPTPVSPLTQRRAHRPAGAAR